MAELGNPLLGLTILVSGEWQSEPSDLALVARAASVSSSGFTPTLVATITKSEGLTLDDWCSITIEALRRTLNGFLLVDDSPGVLGDRAARVLLIAYVNDQGVELTLRQWLTNGRAAGLSLTATCATEDFPSFRVVAEGAASSLSWLEAR
ncbi:MAG TPA: hypothetical protein PKV13_01370 [Propionicimonas sp.]|nr:hypothetical protein [Propionicimonas sp.]HRA05255.1 hypothetical protein [Propionicimonas sp.]